MKDKVVDYFQAMRDFDRAQGKKADWFDAPLRSAEKDGVVNYLSVSREYQDYLEKDRSEMIYVGKDR